MFVRLAYRLGRGYALPLVGDMRLREICWLWDYQHLGWDACGTQTRYIGGWMMHRLSDRWWPVGSTCCLGIGYGIAYPGGSIAVKDHRVTGNRQQETDTVDRGPEIDEDTTDTVDSTSEPTGTH
ncbi:hypothetical protein Tco_1323265 [Tanacetum coccineum]